MILRSIRLQNFRLHADTLVHFPAAGTIAITGSNGSGKSTLATEAILFALFGARGIRKTVKTLRWKRATARRQAEVTLEFELAGKVYTLVRSESDATLYEGQQKIAAGTAAVNQYVPTLIGMDMDEFVSSFMILQKQLERISTMKGTERGEFFRSVLGVSKIDEGLGAIRARKNDLVRECDGLAAGLGEREPLALECQVANAAVELARDCIDDAFVARENAQDAADIAGAALNQSEERRQAWLAVQSEIKAAEHEAHLAHKEVVRVEGIILETRAAQARIDAVAGQLVELPKLRAERESQKAAEAQAKHRQVLENARNNAERFALLAGDRVKEMTETVEAFDEVAHARAQVEHAGAKDALDQKTQQHRELSEQLAVRKSDTSRAQRRLEAISKAGREGGCPTCGRQLGVHFQEVVDGLVEDAERAEAAELTLADHVDELALEIKAIESTATAARLTLEAHARARNAAQIAAKNLAHEQEQHRIQTAEYDRLTGEIEKIPARVIDTGRGRVVDTEIVRLERLERSVQDDQRIADRLPDLALELDQRIEAKAAADDRITLLRHKADETTYSATEHDLLAAEAAKAGEALSIAHQDVVRAEAAMNAAKMRTDRAHAALTAYDSRAERLTRMRADLETYVRADKRLGEFRTAVASTIRPELEELVSGFVAILTDGRHESVELNDDFEVTAYESGIAMEVVSGGGEDVISLAMRLAISQMITQRAGHPLSLLVMDEPITSLDETRRANVLALLQRLQGVFTQVVIISHVPEIRESVQHVVAIEFDEAAGCSRVAEAPAAEVREEVAA